MRPFESSGQRSVFVIGRPVLDDRRVDAVAIEAADKEPLRVELEAARRV